MAKKVVKVNVKVPTALSASGRSVPVKIKTKMNDKLVNAPKGSSSRKR